MIPNELEGTSESIYSGHNFLWVEWNQRYGPEGHVPFMTPLKYFPPEGGGGGWSGAEEGRAKWWNIIEHAMIVIRVVSSCNLITNKVLQSCPDNLATDNKNFCILTGPDR